jgi:hypothetical protein
MLGSHSLSSLHRPPVPPHESARVEWTTPPSLNLVGTSPEGERRDFVS